MFAGITSLLFPRKCVLCEKLLAKDETDLCRRCLDKPLSPGKPKNKVSFLAGWCAIWYYEKEVRQSILRYKFRGRRSYAPAYGRLLAMRIRQQLPPDFDLLTWIPVSPLRRFRRGFDQVQLLAKAVGRELGVKPVRTLRKIRHNRPQSAITGSAQRKANVQGAYRVIHAAALAGKRVLLLDDILTTGATASECARMLLTAGASQVYLGVVATAHHDQKSSR